MPTTKEYPTTPDLSTPFAHRKGDKQTKGKREYDRPHIDRQERRCLCGRPYRYAWAWVLMMPACELIDLCASCARSIRYGGEDERREMAERLASANREWRLAA